ncbi:hypothetical protein OSB04_un000981 [Centaurea solstitialis]|uniref:Integrase catalytic domain-containing protein n=1 Tax=Centaurea solstitialis TaxID=347529 RepID=A0AA38VRC0_9ASTR|nr:hypothetical protein OSB04_un000981 [Centaurea solstitialis]
MASNHSHSNPISVVFNGNNYVLWKHHMTILLKSHGLYSYVTSKSVAPEKLEKENDVDFAKRTNEWDINNAKTLGFINVSTTAEVNQQFLGYTTAKELWDFLANRYTSTGLSHQYQLWTTQNKWQLPDQSVSSYISEMQAIRDQLNLGAPQIHDETARKFQAYFSQLHLITILIGLTDKFVNVRASLLHRHPLPTLEDVITKLLSEETRLQLRPPMPAETVLYTPSSTKPRGSVSSPPDLMDLMRKNQELMEQLMTGSLGVNSPYSSTSADLSPLPVLFSGNFSTNTVQLPEDPKTKQILGVGRRVGRVLEVVYMRLPLQSSTFVAFVSSITSFDLWHACLGHLTPNRIKVLASSGSLGNVSSESVSCLSCKLGKHHALPFDNNEFTSILPFDLIHSDVWGPAPHPSMGGARYFVIFVDDHTRFTWIYLMKHRSELPHIYITFARMILTQFSKPIKILRADNAMEYKESSLLSFLQSQGTLSRYSCPGTSSQNGRAERKHIHILDTVRTLLISAKCPERFWGEAAFTAVYTINRHPTPTLKYKSPYEVLCGVSPLLMNFSNILYQKEDFFPKQRSLLDMEKKIMEDAVPISHRQGYRCWDPISKRLRISRHVTFWEHVPFFSMPNSDSSSPNVPFFTDSSISLDVLVTPPDTPAPVTSPKPVPIPPPTQSPAPFQRSTPELSVESADPGPSQSENVRRSDRTWDSVPLPPGKKPIGSKWIFKIKTKSDGSIDRYKARLVAKGFNQEYGIDYEETFAPLARITSVRCLLAIAATKRWPLFQMDVKNAFLNGDLSEEVYMIPPPGVSLPTGHVDDMIITGSDSAGITILKKSLSANFVMKDLGTLHYFLGLEVLSDSAGTYLCQAKYTSDLISCAGITNNKVASTPLEPHLHLTPNAGPPLKDPTLYRQLVGSLVYLTVTQPDIVYAVHTVSQFMSAPCSDHYAAVLRILLYLKGTMFHGLYFSSTSLLTLRGFSDADWDSDMTDRRSTTGFCFFFGDSLISWRSKKQSLTARSSTEAEYRALADTSQELIWLRWLLSDMGAPQLSPTLLWCDNNSAIQIAHNDVFHERTKHIEIDCHFIRQHVVRKTIQLQPISTTDQPADIFTKAHLPGRFRELVSKLNLGHSSPN